MNKSDGEEFLDKHSPWATCKLPDNMSKTLDQTKKDMFDYYEGEAMQIDVNIVADLVNGYEFLLKNMIKYAAHNINCEAGYDNDCICNHPSNNHFDYSANCAHCSCEKFTVGPCTCGLEKLLKSLN